MGEVLSIREIKGDDWALPGGVVDAVAADRRDEGAGEMRGRTEPFDTCLESGGDAESPFSHRMGENRLLLESDSSRPFSSMKVSSFSA